MAHSVSTPARSRPTAVPRTDALPRLLVAALLVLPPLASAQDRVGGKPPAEPLDARAAVPTLQHAGSVAGYRRHTDVQAVPWAEANATVGRVGGWRAYAREAARPEPAPSAPAGPPPAAAPHHHRHGGTP